MNAWVGRTHTLVVDRLVAPGAMLRGTTPTEATPLGAAREVVLLPRNEVTDAMAAGDAIDVFVYLDSDDRPIATRKAPLVELDEVAFLEVTDIGPIGAFVHWGPVKELLVPHAEQTKPLRVGDRHPIALYVDASGRLAGTMRVTERLKALGVFEEDEWVDGEAWRKEPGVGVFIIVERAFVGLVPEHEPNALKRGESARFRIAHVHADGRIELSLRGHAHEEVARDAASILAFVEAGRGPRIGDRSSPEELRALFGLSKKAFKRALGRLYKERAVVIDESGFVALPKAR